MFRRITFGLADLLGSGSDRVVFDKGENSARSFYILTDGESTLEG
jgi:hypothetical protein